jgi:hypothetical protein
MMFPRRRRAESEPDEVGPDEGVVVGPDSVERRASTHDDIYGVLAEFETPEALLAAARQIRAAGYREIDAFTPFPVDGLADALDFHDKRLPLIVLVGGIVGGLSGYILQYWVSVIAYPVNVGGRPLNSVPSFIPVTFEMTILFAALAGVVGMIVLNGLPEPYHPVFNAPSFARATKDGFFLVVQASDPRFRLGETRAFLRRLNPVEVQDVSE